MGAASPNMHAPFYRGQGPRRPTWMTSSLERIGLCGSQGRPEHHCVWKAMGWIWVERFPYHIRRLCRDIEPKPDEGRRWSVP